MKHMIAGLILAAGESKRMGTPKVLLRIGSESFADRISRVMHQSRIENVILVSGFHHDEVAGNSDQYSVVFNPEFTLGQFSSLQQGVRHLPPKTDYALVWPVDLPLVQQNTIQTLLENAEKRMFPITIPVYAGKKGHPVIYNQETLTKILAMKPVQTGKELLEYFEGRITLVNVNDPGVLIDIDTPEDYEAHITRDDLQS